jgi:hypothetical protein
VRTVPVYEHPKLLEQALLSCKERLLIVSPWITSDVVGRWFLDRVEDAIKRGATVYIGYGLDEHGQQSEPRPKQARAVQMLEQLASKYGHRLVMVRLGDTHAKVLICDDVFAVVTSFNWLSFAGDAFRPFRDERGSYIGIAEKVEEEFEYHSGRIKDALGKSPSS